MDLAEIVLTTSKETYKTNRSLVQEEFVRHEITCFHLQTVRVANHMKSQILKMTQNVCLRMIVTQEI